MPEVMGLTGNDACAEALKQVNPDVAAVFPITPQTEMMHRFASYVHDGEVDTVLVTVESEHSAMSATVGASAAGARAITATASQGLALMWEVLYVASGLRLPICMPVVNRAINSPLNIHNDHTDSMGARDSGWIQLFCENSQEVYDTMIQAFPIAEHQDVLLPVMVCYDGFIISHTMERVQVEDADKVRDFVGEYKPKYALLDADNPLTMGPVDLQNWLFEHKRPNVDAWRNAVGRILEVGEKFGEVFGRSYANIEKYRMDDAEYAFIMMGSSAGTAKAACDELRSAGKKVGVVKVRTYRPFPGREIAEAVKDCKAVAVLDKAFTLGQDGGPLFHDVRSHSYAAGINVPFVPYIHGIGGRDVAVDHFGPVVETLEKVASGGDVPEEQYINLRE